MTLLLLTEDQKEHLNLTDQYLQKFDDVNLRINIPKCHFDQTEIERLGI